MRRGTRVGQAYVAITADGSGINEEIVNSVDAAGDDIDKKGDEHGERYGDHFSEGFFDKIRERFKNRGEDGAFGFGNKAGKSTGAKIGDNIAKSLFEKIDALGPEASTRLRSMFAAVEESSRKAEAALARVENDNGKSPTRLANLTHAARTAENAATRMERAWRAALRAEGLLDAAVSRNRGGGGGKDKGLTGIDDWLSGSRFRNNALNILAKGLGGVIHGFEKVAILSKNFVSNMQNAEEGASLFAKIGAGFGSGGAEGAGLFSKIAASGPGAAIATLAVAAAVSLLVTVMNALLAIVVALAATIASALVGALAVGAGAFAAIGAAAGLAVLAFKSMTDVQKKALTSAFKPLHEEAVGLGQVMIKQMVPAFAEWSKHLQTALALAQPLATVMGGAFAKAGNILSSALSGPGIQLFLGALTTTLPGIVRNLSRALGGFLNGVGGVFAAIMPSVLTFSRYLSRIATDFAAWASSAGGQNAISDFVDRALASLHSLASFTGAVGGLIAHLLFSTQGQTAGNNIFDQMTQGIRNFTAYLTPGRMQHFFDEGQRLATSLGDAIHAAVVALAAFDDAGVLTGIASVANGARRATDAFRKLPPAVRDSVKPFGLIASASRLMAAAVVGSIVVIIAALGLLLRGAAKTVAAMARIPVIGKAFKGMAGAVNAAADDVQGLATSMSHIPRNLLVSVGADTSPAAAALQRLISQIRSLHINVPVTASTNATIGEASAISTGHPTVTGTVTGSSGALQSSGSAALAGTSSGGGGGGGGGKKKYHNPYVAFANKLINEGPTVAAQIKNAILTVNKQVQAAIADAARSTSADALQNSLTDTISSMITSAAETVNTAQSALNSAAQSLASATSKKAAKRALKEVRASQTDLKAALADQKKIQAAAAILDAQKVISGANVEALLRGINVTNATLADYAEARSRVADMLASANQKLTEALQLRDSYSTQVADSIKSFGALISAQAQVIDGVEQALTADDITSNLQDKLTQIQKFQTDLRLLLAQGLSNDAYKQIVDAGVEQGSTIADALLAGGNGAIQQTNSLVSQITGIADTLGSETSSRLYQAGVDAAQGLVDGLTSLSAQLDAAAYQLGTTIANAVKAALGIASPSRVLIGLMDHVGDGAVVGLGNQHNKVGTAASAFAAKVAVSPEVAAYANQQNSQGVPFNGGVSGNGERPIDIDLTINTATEDPYAVANEVINEVVGRL